MKKALETRQPRYRLAGDSAYPRSVMLVTPFSSEEGENDLRKRLFNLRHAGLRTECTENIFGMWKRRFPIVRNLRNHFDNALEIVMATAVLHNLAVLWNEGEPYEADEDSDKDSDISENSDEEYVPGRSRDGRFELQKITGTRLRQKLDGTILRDNLLENMAEGTAREMRRIKRKM